MGLGVWLATGTVVVVGEGLGLAWHAANVPNATRISTCRHSIRRYDAESWIAMPIILSNAGLRTASVQLRVSPCAEPPCARSDPFDCIAIIRRAFWCRACTC